MRLNATQKQLIGNLVHQRLHILLPTDSIFLLVLVWLQTGGHARHVFRDALFVWPDVLFFLAAVESCNVASNVNVEELDGQSDFLPIDSRLFPARKIREDISR